MKAKHKNYVRFFILVGIIVFSLNNLLSCSGNKLTTKEAQVVEEYTKAKDHDTAIIGEWIDNSTWEFKGTINKINISFDELGIKKERMYRDGKAFNDWHFIYYYYTDQGKILMYRPAEKGFLAMDGEIYEQCKYQVSEDGNTLTIGDKTYTKHK
jgi:arginyl-tRNA synthetase